MTTVAFIVAHMTHIAYFIWTATGLYLVWRLIANLQHGRRTRKHLREIYGDECCKLLLDKENQKVDGPFTEDDTPQEPASNLSNEKKTSDGPEEPLENVEEVLDTSKETSANQ